MTSMHIEALSAPLAPHAASTPRPSAWLARWMTALAPGARVLDFASGSGRNMPLIVGQGGAALAVDRDRQAVENLRGMASCAEAGAPGSIQVEVADLEADGWRLARQAFDAVVVGNYLFRPRLAMLIDLLAPSGVLIYETFAVGQAEFGRPTNPDFLLRPGELFDTCRRAGLQVLAYEDGVVGELAGGIGSADSGRSRPARVQRICAVRAPVDHRRFRLDAALV